MRRALPFAALAAFVLTSSTLRAQNDRFAYAITDLTKEGASWNALRKLDLQTGQYSNVLLNGTDNKMVVYDAVTRKPLAQQADAKFGTMLQSPFATGVAAAAYDKKHNRLYFTPMFVDQLRFIDLRTMKVYYVNQPFTKLGSMHNDEGKIITRMVIGPDGYGYAISNDGNTFIRFSTGKKTTIVQQLGTLVDDASNNGISIHNRCSSFGGDMICDDKGNLIILTARNGVFTVNTQTKVAKFLGNISGLGQNFTVNGAVVDGDGNLLVSSAVDGSSYYIVNPANWSAKPYATTGAIFRSSDLANSNYLSAKTPKLTTSEIQRLIRPEEKFANSIAVYPNPVTTSTIKLQFTKVPAGNYTVELRDVLGRRIMERRIAIESDYQTQELRLDRRNTNGVYMVKVFDGNNQSVFTQKLVVQ
ncbi:MAG: T9SS type A sorting domain-containing protein [Flavisolibacter sp.]